MSTAEDNCSKLAELVALSVRKAEMVSFVVSFMLKWTVVIYPDYTKVLVHVLFVSLQDVW